MTVASVATVSVARAQAVPLVVPAGTVAPAMPRLGTPSTPSQAGTLDLSAGFGETDNIGMTPDKKSQTDFTAGLDFAYLRTGSALTANLGGNFNFFDYLQGADGSQVVGRFDGQGALSLWQDRLRWMVEDSYGESQLNSLQGAAPDNLEHVNVASTGPELVLRPWQRTQVLLGAIYTRTDYQTSLLSGWSSLESAAILHELPGDSSIAANAEFGQLHFDQTDVTPDYDMRRYYATYRISGARTQIQVSAGVGQVDETGSWKTDPYIDAYGLRELTPQVSLNLRYIHRLTNGTETFQLLREGAAAGIMVAPAIESGGSYLTDTVSAQLTYTGPRTTVSLTTSWMDDSYETVQDEDQDQRMAVVQLAATRQVSRKVSLTAQASYQRAMYTSGTMPTFIGVVGVNWMASRNLSVQLQYGHGFGTPPQGLSYNYNTEYLTLTYHPVPAMPALPGGPAGALSPLQ